MDPDGSLWRFHSIHVFREKLITAAVAQLSGSASSAGAEGADDFDDAEPVDKVVATEAARRVTISLTRAVKGPGGSGILKEGELSKQGGKTTLLLSGLQGPHPAYANALF